MSAVGDARKRLALVSTSGLPGYFVDGDVIWRGTGPDDPTCQPAIDGWRLQRDDLELWTAIVALVEGGAA